MISMTISSSKQYVTVKDIKQFVSSRDRDVRISAQSIVELSERGGKDAVTVDETLGIYNDAIGIAYSIVQKLARSRFNIFVKPTLEDLLSNEEFPESTSDLFPVVLVVAANSDAGDAISLIVEKNGKVEIFEGNDMASSDTSALINRILGLDKKPVKVYGSHSREIVDSILDSGKLPSNLYVSPDIKYASGFYGEDRVLFSGIITGDSVNQESHVDWKVIKECKINNVRILN